MKQVQQPERLNGIEYSHIGFEAECASAIIYITLNGLRSSIGNRRFKLNEYGSVIEIMLQDVGSAGDFIISGDNAKSYLACFGENDGTFKSLECLFFNSGTNNISDDFNSFRNILLTFYNRIINGAERVKNSDDTFSASFKIGENEFIKIVNNEQLMDLENTRFQATLTVDSGMMLRDFKHNDTKITDEHIDVYHKENFDLFGDLFDYMVYTFLKVYQNKVGKLYNTSEDRKKFVPLALRNILSEIILNERERNLFALDVKREIIRQIGNNKNDDEWRDWESLLDTYVFNMPRMLDISHIYVPDSITFEIRCFERTFLKARPIKQKDKKNRKKTIQKAKAKSSSKKTIQKAKAKSSSKIMTTTLVNSDDEKSGGDDEKSGKYDWLDDSDNDEEHKGGTVRRRKTQRLKKTTNIRKLTKTKYVREHAK